jgi:Arc/MetJ-type ribon-helix-helix transcriptional regulator
MVRKIAVTLNQKTVTDLDRWIREGRYPNRSRVPQSAREQTLAEEGLGDKAWPEY